MSEVVDSSDPEFVLRVLETCLLTQWDDVTREGSTIVLRGLGPSHRALNRNDRTVFTATAAEGQKTMIAADVTYQASALVGTAAPQNEMVQRKLDAVLEMVRMDLDLAQRRRAQVAQRAAERVVKPILVPVEVVPQPMPVEQSAEALPRQVPEEQKAEVAQVAPEPMMRVEPVVAAPLENVEAAAVESSADGAAVAARNEPPVLPPALRSEPPSAPAPQPYFQPHDDVDRTANPAEAPIAFQASRPTVAPQRPMDMEEVRLVHREEADDEIEDEEPGSGIAKVFVTLMVLVVLAAGGWVGWQHRAQIEETHAFAASRAWVMNLMGESTQAGVTPAAAPASVDDTGSATGSTAGAPVAGSTPAASGSASTLTEGPVPPAETSAGAAAPVAGSPASSTPGVAAATPEDAAAAEKATQEEKLSELDPAKWLQNWAEAMRGTDAALLSQYYADPVNRYYLQSYVSRARVMADKQATMAKREQPWTVQLDNVQLLDRTPSTARALLIKHFSMGQGAAARQVRWPTQLRLKMIDGRWEITSEQTLGE